MNAGKSDASPSVLDRVEQLLKLAASLAAIAVATGLPAVYVQYSRLGIPTSFITNEQIFRAGIAPASLFLSVGAYVLSLIREYKNGGSVLTILLPTVILAPIPISGFIIYVIGMLAACTWLCWVILYPVFYTMPFLAHARMEPARMHFWAANALLCLLIAWFLIFASGKKVVVPRLVAAFVEKIAPLVEPPKEKQKESAFQKPAMQVQPPSGWREARSVLFISVAAYVYLFVGLFAIRWYLQQLDVSLGPLSETSSILIVPFVVVLTGGVLGLGQILKEVGALLPATLFDVSVVILGFVCAVWWYSTALYPKIPAGLGGGNPDGIVVWMDSKSLPPEVLMTLPGAYCTAAASIMYCHLQLISRNDKDVILAAPGDGVRAAVLVPRDAIKAISWAKD